MSRNLETVECSTGESPDYSVIWLHGLGADGHDFEPIVPELELSGLSIRFVFPHAPVRPVTLNGGMPMRAWFDLLDLDRQGRQDETGIRASADQVEALIQRENARGIGSERIVLAGFSQGGAIALHLGLRRPAGLAGNHGAFHLSAIGGQPAGRSQPDGIENSPVHGPWQARSGVAFRLGRAGARSPSGRGLRGAVARLRYASRGVRAGN